MRYSFYAVKSLLFPVSLLAALALSGCAIDPTEVAGGATASVHPGGFQGSNFGGHAPIVGAKVFLLQAGTGGYGTAATSLLTASAGGTDTTVVGPSQTAQAWQTAGTAHYVTTDGAGNFNISGDYACTPGLPVYLYAYAGAPDSNPAVGYSTLVSGSYTSAANTLPATGYTITYTLVVNQQKFYPGQTVSFTITPGQTVPAFASLNGQTGVVQSVNPNNVSTLQNTTFSVAVQSATAPSASSGFGNFAGVSVVTPIGVQNPAIVNVAMLGNCPTSGETNFGSSSSNPINFVFMNEVSTAATMFALAPFAETSTISGGVVTRTGTDAQHIGIPPGDSLALTGLQNAAVNAGQLYDITGGNSSGTTDGEGHVARTTVPGSSTSIVPQALINTLGNILASCVDSANTAGLGVTGGTYSPACSTLFSTATADGTTSGANPTDIATAAINIAHYPAGVGNANFVSKLYSLPGVTVPFSPYLTSQPTDFTIGINITTGNIFLGSNAVPQGIATDSNGNAFVTTTGCVNGCTVELLPTQVSVGTAYSGGGSGVAVDATGRVWVVNSTQANGGGAGAPAGAFYVANSLPLSASSFTGYGGSTDFAKGTVSIALDGNGVAYVGDSGETYIHKITGLGGLLGYTEYLLKGAVGNLSGQLNCEADVQAVAVDSQAKGYNIWTVDNAQTATQGMCTVSNAALSVVTSLLNPVVNTATVFSQFGPQYNPGGVAIDANGNGWDSNSPSPNNTGEQFPGTFGSGQYSGDFGFGYGGGLNGDYGVAIDGNDNIWYANVAGNSVSLFKNLGTATSQAQISATAITPSTGYTAGGTMSGPKQIAIDLSGDVWVTNTSSSGVGYSVTELIGAAAPTYTPLALAAKNNKLGAKP